MRKLLKLLPALALLVGLMASPGVSIRAAAPPGPYFNGFEKNTNGWFGVGGSTITRTSSGTAASYAGGISSASGNWHARLGITPTPGTCSPSAIGPQPWYFGPATDWGGLSSRFPPGGYKTSVDIYLDVVWAKAVAHQDKRLDWSSEIADTSANPRRDFVFNVGTTPLGFVVVGGNNANRCGADPYTSDPSHFPSVQIINSGWYTFQHSFNGTAGGVLTVTMTLIQKSTGTVLGTWTRSDPSDIIGSTVGGNAYGWFVQNEIDQMAIDNSLRTGLCRSGGGDGDVEDKDSGKHGHMHFNGNGCEGGQQGGDVEEQDQNSGDNFQSNNVSSTTFSSGEDSQTMTMVGTGLHSGLPVAFTMVAIDSGTLAPALFSLVLSDGYAITGSVTSGSISIP